MTPFGPAPQRLEYCVIYALEDDRADRMPVIHRPAPNDRVELADECAGCECLVALDDRPYLTQERFDALVRGFNQQFSMVFPYVLAEEVKPVVDMGNRRFLG